MTSSLLEEFFLDRDLDLFLPFPPLPLVLAMIGLELALISDHFSCRLVYRLSSIASVANWYIVLLLEVHPVS